MAAIEKNRYNCRSIGRLNKLFDTNEKRTANGTNTNKPNDK